MKQDYLELARRALEAQRQPTAAACRSCGEIDAPGLDAAGTCAACSRDVANKAPLCSEHPAANPWARHDGERLCSGCHPEPPSSWWAEAAQSAAHGSTDGGCARHGVTPVDYARRWAAAYRSDAPGLAVCRCCCGPTSNDSTLLCRACEPPTERAARLAPVVRLSVHEREDGGDIALLRRLRAILSEYPGGNLVHVALRLRDGRVVIAEWRALATRELRMALGRALARHATGVTADGW